MNSHSSILPLDVLFIDEGILAIDKPAGLLSVPGRGADKADCVIRRAQQQWPDALIVHRLDQATSGVLVLARGALMQRELSIAFASRNVDKRYEAIVHGDVTGDAGVIDAPLIADWPNRPRQMVDHAVGKPSVTHWQVIERHGGTTRLALMPVTGRSHQLRVHLLSIGHPIVGDALYGPPQQSDGRLMLHACGVAFDRPGTGERLQIHSPVPF